MKNMKFIIESTKHSASIQEALFALGYDWSESDLSRKVMYTDAPFLYTNVDGCIYYGDSRSLFDSSDDIASDISTLNFMMSIMKQADKLKLEIDGLNNDRSYYNSQSEWHILMLRLVSKYETLINAI